jgi:CTP:molybdopterin cytidylyltransferase MocA
VFISYRDRQARLVPLHRSNDQRWVTFFSHPADKGKEVMLEYNERAAVSRLLIPAIVESWKETDAGRYAAWMRALEATANGTDEKLEEIESLIQGLPETLTIAEVGRLFPDAYRDLALSFPALISERGQYPLRVRGLAAHHASEVRRVCAAQESFSRRAAAGHDNEESELEMHSLGALLNESHQSLRDNYRVSTDNVERLVGLLRPQKGVYGVRLMGGGFGGNVLALTSKENVEAIIDRVQSEYYEPQGRNGVSEGSVMISTPGDGLSQLSLETPWRRMIEEFNSLGLGALDYRDRVESLLDCLPFEFAEGDIQPVIVAAGKGSRAQASGLDQPKPLASVSGVPAILRVLKSVRAALPGGRAPVVIVSPGNETAIRRALAEEDVLFVTQPAALGTGDAVLRAADSIRAATRTLVIWGTQPVIRRETISRTLKLSALFDEFEMVLPTAMMESPYAPLSRNELGRVVKACETHLERAAAPPFGETNLGLFFLKSEALLNALGELHRRNWLESDQRYDRPAGELGFPNEMINFLSSRDDGVFACPVADWREAQGIKSREDVALCERFIAELQE